MHSGGVNKTDTAQTAPNDTIKFTPLFGYGELKLQTTTKAVTPFAGMASFFAWLGALEFPKRAAEVMPFDHGFWYAENLVRHLANDLGE
jgi:hypothetical protein